MPQSKISRWKVLRAVWLAAKAFEQMPPSSSLTKKAFEHWENVISPESTQITSGLKVKGNVFGRYEACLLASVVAQSKILTVLKVSSVPCDYAMMRSLSRTIATCPALQVLFFSSLDAGPCAGPMLWGSLVELAKLQESSGSRLEVLDLRGNALGAEGMEGGAAALASLSGLRSLNLSGNRLGDRGVEEIVRAFEFSASETKVDEPAGVRRGAGGPRQVSMKASVPQRKKASLSELTELHIGSNKVGDSGLHVLLARLADSSVAPMLKVFDVSNNPLTAKPASYAARATLEARRKHRMRSNPVGAGKPVKEVPPRQMDDDGTPKRFIPGLALRPTNPRASKVLRELELVITLNGGFMLSEVPRDTQTALLP